MRDDFSVSRYGERSPYQGARYAVGEVAAAAMPRDVTQRDREEGARKAWENVAEFEKKAVEANDYYAAVNDSERLYKLKQECEAELARRMRLPDDDEDSLMDATTGQVSEVKLRDFMQPYIEEGSTMGRRIMNPELLTKVRGQAADTLNGIVGFMQKEALRIQDERNEAAFITQFGGAMEREDLAGAMAAIDEAERMKVISAPEAARKRLQVGHARMAKRGGVRVGGVEYGGVDAALAAQAAKDGYEVNAETEEKQESPSVGDGEIVYTKKIAGDGIALNTDDDTLTIRGMSDADLADLTQLWVPNAEIRQEMRDDGTMSFTVSEVAPEAVERVAAVANVQGAVDEETARAMVARMSIDAVTQDPDATAEQICKMFDESGIYETLGGGDAEVGKVRTTSVIHEMVRRGKQGSAVLNNKNVEDAVEAVVMDEKFGEGSEWKLMEGLNPGVGEDGEYKKPTDEEGRKRWFGLYEVYKKYRDRFNPQHQKGEPDRKEFAKAAQKFYKWYMGGSHVYKDAKAAEINAARDWYTAKVYEGLLGNMSVSNDGKAGYGSYASDVAVMREVLRQQPPRTLGAEERLRMLEGKERDAAARSEKFRRRAQNDYETLRGMKQEHKANSEKAQKARDKAAADEKKAAKKEEERLAAIEIRKRNVMRRMPRSAEWGWDKKKAPDGARPACTLPEDEYKRLVDELGYDGTQDVYIQVAGANIQVVGTNKQGRVMLNSPAVAKVQKKPSAKKGEKWKLEGTLGFSYDFKNVSANN